jgi:hypothetical protein
MDKQTNLDKIRKACIEANPQGHWLQPSSAVTAPGSFVPENRPIRLADVLLAIECKFSEPTLPRVSLWGVANTIELWNFRDDNLEHQSEATINFIALLI